MVGNKADRAQHCWPPWAPRALQGGPPSGHIGSFQNRLEPWVPYRALEAGPLGNQAGRGVGRGPSKRLSAGGCGELKGTVTRLCFTSRRCVVPRSKHPERDVYECERHFSLLARERCALKVHIVLKHLQGSSKISQTTYHPHGRSFDFETSESGWQQSPSNDASMLNFGSMTNPAKLLQIAFTDGQQDSPEACNQQVEDLAPISLAPLCTKHTGTQLLKKGDRILPSQLPSSHDSVEVENVRSPERLTTPVARLKLRDCTFHL